MKPETTRTEVLIIGAGGAGLMCAIHAGRRGRKVLLLDHAEKLGGKILISGGGRCNFTNLGAGPANYVSRNPHFCKSALSRYTPRDFVQMVENHGIAYHEKKLGQQFCDESARDIVAMLETEVSWAGAEVRLGCKIDGVSALPGESAPLRYRVETSQGPFECESLVIATGGLSIPKIGATGLGYDIAKQFGLRIVPREPALDGFTFWDAEMHRLKTLSGVSVDCVITCNGISFRENILFTHSGLSGPAALQASLHWHKNEGKGEPDVVTINLLPEAVAIDWFLAKKKAGSRSTVPNLLAELLPARFADLLCTTHLSEPARTLPLPQVSEKELRAFCELLHAWVIHPSGTVGYGKAEVTRGGVDTDELSSKTLEARKAPGMYFIGEVVDVTGWLGGYNFQWAWASGHAAGLVV